MNSKYEWKDVWLLASIAMAENSDDEDSSGAYKKLVKSSPNLVKLKNIEHVISAGDYIDRSIFTVEELSTGISKLLNGEFIEIENNYLKTTRKTNEYYDKEMGDRKHVSIKTALRIFRQLLDVKSN